MKYKFVKILKGYSEVVYDTPEEDFGVVRTERFVKYTDFEKDEIYDVKRWIPMIYTGERYCFNGLRRIGRLTGYKTRKEALDVLTKYVSDRVEARKEALDDLAQYLSDLEETQ